MKNFDRPGDVIDGIRNALMIEALVACVIIAAICFILGNLQ